MDANAPGQDSVPTNISPSVAGNIDRVLASIRSYLDMDVAFVSEFLGANRIFRNVDSARPNAPIKAGGVIPMAAGYCQHVVAGRLPELIPNTSSVSLARTIPETKTIPIGAHLSVPIRLDDGRIFGTFCCFSYQPNPRLDQRDLDLMRTFGRLVATQLALDLEADRARRAKVELLRAAVGHGDPHMVFQPILRLDDLTPTGVESLSRFMTEPRRTPDVWFADAHDAGIGVAMELLAARKALAECAALPAPLAVNVNLSPGTVTDPRTAEALSGFDPRRLIIEITEHTPIEDYAPLLAAVANFRNAGMRIAIDDAGSGYSSLRHVLFMRPDIIKLDISLTRNVHKDPLRKAMAAALAEFAQRTGTSIVAEGIETAEELATLRELRIDKGQGYHLGRPQKLSALLDEIARATAPAEEKMSA